jgi:membrane AbrB-like protein
MIAVAVAALARRPVVVPAYVREPALVLLGFSMGAAVTPASLASAASWPASLALLAVCVVTVIALGTFWLERRYGWDPLTARFSAVPGSMAYIVTLAAGSRADLTRVALAQSVRLFTLVAVMPWLLTRLFPVGAAAAPPTVTGLDPLDLGQAVVATLAGALLFRQFRLPGGVLLGAMAGSALAHGTGLSSAHLPDPIVTVGLLLLGAAIGARFAGASLTALRATVRSALEIVALALAVSAAFAGLGAALLGLPFDQLWLAFAPGGLDAMTVLAFTLDLDPAFVGTHHFARFIGISLLAPLWLRSWLR